MTASRRAPSSLLLQQRVAALRRQLPGARNGDVRSVHQARVATRRLREALPLIRAGKPGRRLERVARELTGVLGTVRELDVALEMLDGLARTDGVPSAAVTCLHRAVANERDALQRDSAGRIDEYDMERLERKVLRTLERKGDRQVRAVDRQAQISAARRRAARRAARLEAAMDSAGAS